MMPLIWYNDTNGVTKFIKFISSQHEKSLQYFKINTLQ